MTWTREMARTFFRTVSEKPGCWIDIATVPAPTDDEIDNAIIPGLGDFLEKDTTWTWKNPDTSFLVNSNIKIGKGVFSFSTMFSSTCPRNVNCAKLFPFKKKDGTDGVHIPLCYVASGMTAYGQSLVQYWRNFFLIFHSNFVDKMVAECKRRKVKYLRISVSGDLFSQMYVDKLFEIARRLINDKVTVYTYTKWEGWDYSMKPSNFVLNFSHDLFDTSVKSFDWADQTTHIVPYPGDQEDALLAYNGTLCMGHQEVTRADGSKFIMTCGICQACFKPLPGRKIVFRFHVGSALKRNEDYLLDNWEEIGGQLYPIKFVQFDDIFKEDSDDQEG